MIEQTDYTIQALRRMFAERGALEYGENVNQVEHALQCAALAEQDGASPQLIVAALLHDIGHMLHRDAAAALEQGDDDRHELLGAKCLVRSFGLAVSEPVRLHVQAKRYLCASEPGYRAQLSDISKRTLQLQGGPMSAEQMRRFEDHPFARDALRLRRWDDEGKKADARTPPLEHFLALAGACATAR